MEEPTPATNDAAGDFSSAHAPESTDAPAGDAETLRGRLFTDLDRLAFALEIEAAEALESGDEAEALRIEDRRLGVRLAQRLVAGVHADEVDLRVDRVRKVYDRRMSEG